VGPQPEPAPEEGALLLDVEQDADSDIEPPGRDEDPGDDPRDQ
jgi:hypothetical protein